MEVSPQQRTSILLSKMLSPDPRNVSRPTNLSEEVEVAEVGLEVEGLLEVSLDEDETRNSEILLPLVDRKRTTTRWTEKAVASLEDEVEVGREEEEGEEEEEETVEDPEGLPSSDWVNLAEINSYLFLAPVHFDFAAKK